MRRYNWKKKKKARKESVLLCLQGHSILHHRFPGTYKKQRFPQSQYCVYFPRKRNKHPLTKYEIAPPFSLFMEGFWDRIWNQSGVGEIDREFPVPKSPVLCVLSFIQQISTNHLLSAICLENQPHPLLIVIRWNEFKWFPGWSDYLSPLIWLTNNICPHNSFPLKS